MDCRFPIGKLKLPNTINKDAVDTWISEIEEAAAKLSKAVEGLSKEQLDTPYRLGGWTLRH